jgi:DNA-binding MarR family transcriptional regulator
MQAGKPMNRSVKPSDFELEHFLPYRLSLLTNTVSAGIAQAYRHRHDISVTEWRVMAVLGRYPGLTASEIVERTAVDKVAISRAVKRLSGRNFIERIADPADRRRMRLHITTGPGGRVLGNVIPLAQRYEEDLLETLSGEEKRVLGIALKKLLTRARELNAG